MSLFGSVQSKLGSRFPRVSGDEPWYQWYRD